jgi:hypothetical protein
MHSSLAEFLVVDVDTDPRYAHLGEDVRARIKIDQEAVRVTGDPALIPRVLYIMADESATSPEAI